MKLYYLTHIIILLVFLFLFGVYFAGKGSEYVGNGKKPEMIGPAEVQEWIREKWDLFFDDISAKIKKE